jgi:ribonuclease P protein component
MNFTYTKTEKLKSKITIDLLFSKGKSVSKYPLRLVYVESDYGIAQNSE